VHTESIIPIDITLLTGINNEMLEEADSIEVVLPKFIKFIGSHKLVGHNIKAFDIYFINKACQDLELPTVKNELVDTLQLSRKILPELDNHKLSTICDFYNIDSSNAHRALADCYMCNECYKNMLSDDTPPTNEVEVSDEDASNSPFEKNILSLLNEIIVDLELPPKGLVLQRNRGKRISTASIYINEPPYPATKDDYEKINTTQSILKFQEKEDFVILTIKKIAFDENPCPENIPYKDKTKFVEVSFPLSNPELYTYIKNIILFRIKHYISAANTFSCCSQFTACSDARKCVHENKLYSTACSYRMNLESGRIFYGKNRNVD
jgi:DNA polymerase III epsilon subunit family exonuclease